MGKVNDETGWRLRPSSVHSMVIKLCRAPGRRKRPHPVVRGARWHARYRSRAPGRRKRPHPSSTLSPPLRGRNLAPNRWWNREGSASIGREILPLRFAQGFGSRAQHDRARYLSLITLNARPIEDKRVWIKIL